MPSSVIKSFRYDEGQGRLEITFASGRTYFYKDVPPERHHQMRNSFSKGKFFNVHIRDHYAYERVGALTGRAS